MAQLNKLPFAISTAYTGMPVQILVTPLLDQVPSNAPGKQKVKAQTREYLPTHVGMPSTWLQPGPAWLLRSYKE